MSPSPTETTKATEVVKAVDDVKSVKQKDAKAVEPTTPPRTTKRRRDASQEREEVVDSPTSPNSPARNNAGSRAGDRASTPHSPPDRSRRSSIGLRAATPTPGLRRHSSRSSSFSSTSSLLSSSDKENMSFVRSGAPSPSPKKKGKPDCRGRSRPLSRTSSEDSLSGFIFDFDFRVPSNTPRALSRTSSFSDESSTDSVEGPSTPPPLLERAIARYLEIEITRKIKEYTESPLADITEAYTGKRDPVLDADHILCPPNTPSPERVVRDW